MKFDPLDPFKGFIFNTEGRCQKCRDRIFEGWIGMLSAKGWSVICPRCGYEQIELLKGERDE